MIIDTTKSIYLSATRYLSGTLLSRVTGMLRDMAMAFAFGTAAPLAAFMVAFRFAHLARRLFGEGSLQNTFIPHFEDFRKTDPNRAFAFFRDLSATLLLILSGGIIFTMGVLGFLLSQVAFSQETTDILFYTLLMLPSLIFICLYGLNAALLSCEKSYFIAGIAPVGFNLVWIATSLALVNFPFQEAMTYLSLSVIAACFAQWLVTIPRVLEILPAYKKIQPFSDDVKTLLRPLFLANFGVAASQINNALDPLFALFANTEGPAWLWFAIRVQQLPLALFGIALANALVPPISRAIKSGNIEQFHQFFNYAEKKVLTFTTLITAGIFAVAPTCINLLYGRGQFAMESVEGTALCLLGYGIGLFPMAYVLIAAPSLFAFGDYKTPTRAACICMLLNVALNSLFVFGFQWNSASVALATSLSSFWNAHYLSRALKAKISFDPKVGLIALFALSTVFAFDYMMMGQIPALQLLRGIPLNLSQNFMDQLVILTAEACAFLIATCVGLYAIKNKDLFD